MRIDYRTLARDSTSRAKGLLATGIDDQLRYVALELRFAMEALTYDRAQAYAAEIPPEEMATWQPDKVMKVLLEIEPAADSSYTLRIGREPYPGGTPAEMHTLGTDTVFSLANLRKHYHAVGSMLHTPTMHQMEQAMPLDTAKLRARLEAIAQDLTKSLASQIRNSTFGDFAKHTCQRCAKPIRKRLPTGQQSMVASCFSCGAQYEVSLLDGRKTWWEPATRQAKCPTENCSGEFVFWADEIKPGAHWSCSECKKPYRIELGISLDTAVQGNKSEDVPSQR